MYGEYVEDQTLLDVSGRRGVRIENDEKAARQRLLDEAMFGFNRMRQQSGKRPLSWWDLVPVDTDREIVKTRKKSIVDHLFMAAALMASHSSMRRVVGETRDDVLDYYVNHKGNYAGTEDDDDNIIANFLDVSETSREQLNGGVVMVDRVISESDSELHEMYLSFLERFVVRDEDLPAEGNVDENEVHEDELEGHIEEDRADMRAPAEDHDACDDFVDQDDWPVYYVVKYPQVVTILDEVFRRCHVPLSLEEVSVDLVNALLNNEFDAFVVRFRADHRQERWINGLVNAMSRCRDVLRPVTAIVPVPI